MALLLDTHVLVWLASDDPRLSDTAKTAILDPDVELMVSGVVAYEFEDLRARGRFGRVDSLGVVIAGLEAVLIDYPAEAYRLLPLLPDEHRDPLDRMLVAHAIHADLTLVTADADIHKYPVRWLW